jgi:hypothetical protein
LQGITTKPRTIAPPPKVIDLMEGLKRSPIEKGALPDPPRPSALNRLTGANRSF